MSYLVLKELNFELVTLISIRLKPGSGRVTVRLPVTRDTSRGNVGRNLIISGYLCSEFISAQ